MHVSSMAILGNGGEWAHAAFDWGWCWRELLAMEGVSCPGKGVSRACLSFYVA